MSSFSCFICFRINLTYHQRFRLFCKNRQFKPVQGMSKVIINLNLNLCEPEEVLHILIFIELRVLDANEKFYLIIPFPNSAIIFYNLGNLQLKLHSKLSEIFNHKRGSTNCILLKNAAPFINLLFSATMYFFP